MWLTTHSRHPGPRSLLLLLGLAAQDERSSNLPSSVALLFPPPLFSWLPPFFHLHGRVQRLPPSLSKVACASQGQASRRFASSWSICRSRLLLFGSQCGPCSLGSRLLAAVCRHAAVVGGEVVAVWRLVRYLWPGVPSISSVAPGYACPTSLCAVAASPPWLDVCSSIRSMSRPGSSYACDRQHHGRLQSSRFFQERNIDRHGLHAPTECGKNHRIQ